MTLARLWSFLALALPVLGALIAGLPSVDLAYQLRAGGEILDAGRVPTTDSWTFTVPGGPWHDQQWLSQVLLALTYRIGGWTALVVLRAALVGLVFGLLAIAVRRRNEGLSARTTALLVIGAFAVSSGALGLRPQLLGIALFALTLVLLGERGRDRRLLWAIPLVAAAWANIHGSFVLAPVLCGLAWLEDLHDREPGGRLVLGAGVAAGAATLVNPAGLGVWSYAVELAQNPVVAARVTEWQPATLGDPQGLLFWGSVALVGVLLARRARVTPWPTFAWLGVFGFLGASAVRGLAWWPLVAAVAVAGLLPAEVPARHGIGGPSGERSRTLNVLLAGAIAFSAVAFLPAWRPLDPGLDAPAGVVGNAPSGITTELRRIARPGDHLWAPQSWGSWFEFAVPHVLLAVDARIELYPEDLWRAYDAVAMAGTEWSAVLERFDVDLVVVARDQVALDSAIRLEPRWTKVYRDDDGAIWVRTDGGATG